MGSGRASAVPFFPHRRRRFCRERSGAGGCVTAPTPEEPPKSTKHVLYNQSGRRRPCHHLASAADRLDTLLLFVAVRRIRLQVPLPAERRFRVRRHHDHHGAQHRTLLGHHGNVQDEAEPEKRPSDHRDHLDHRLPCRRPADGVHHEAGARERQDRRVRHDVENADGEKGAHAARHCVHRAAVVHHNLLLRAHREVAATTADAALERSKHRGEADVLGDLPRRAEQESGENARHHRHRVLLLRVAVHDLRPRRRVRHPRHEQRQHRSSQRHLRDRHLAVLRP